jgi:hypothetical protein
VYDTVSGIQKCLHHDLCTPEFLEWERSRFEDLKTQIGPTVPLSKLILYESVPALRVECSRRCDTPEERKSLIKLKTEAQLQKWLLRKCRCNYMF